MRQKRPENTVFFDFSVKLRNLDFGFRVLDFGSLDFGFCIWDFGFWISGF